MTDEAIDRAIDTLLEICDPRGHDLLESMRRQWKLYERLTAEVENESHSRNAESRANVIWLREA